MAQYKLVIDCEADDIEDFNDFIKAVDIIGEFAFREYISVAEYPADTYVAG